MQYLFNKKILLSFFCLFVYCLLAAGSTSDKKESTAKPENLKPEVSVSASKLFQDYQDNEVAADENYKNRIIEVSGTVHSIAKDITNTIYITFETGKQFQIMSVQCFFDNKYTKDVAQLSKGMSVTVKGLCTGKFGNIFVKESVLIK